MIDAMMHSDAIDLARMTIRTTELVFRQLFAESKLSFGRNFKTSRAKRTFKTPGVPSLRANTTVEIV